MQALLDEIGVLRRFDPVQGNMTSVVAVNSPTVLLAEVRGAEAGSAHREVNQAGRGSIVFTDAGAIGLHVEDDIFRCVKVGVVRNHRELASDDRGILWLEGWVCAGSHWRVIGDRNEGVEVICACQWNPLAL